MSRLSENHAWAYAQHIQGWMRQSELRWLHKITSHFKDPINWLEIGSWKGRSLVMTALGLPAESRLITIEPFMKCPTSSSGQAEMTWPFPWVENHFKLALELIKGLRPDITVIHHKASSELAQIMINDPQDVIFIDGNHTEEVVTQDITIFRNKIKPGGILAGHDRGHEGVNKALKKTGVKWKPAAGSIWWARI